MYNKHDVDKEGKKIEKNIYQWLNVCLWTNYFYSSVKSKRKGQTVRQDKESKEIFRLLL